jgi:hypothetical protein
MSKTTVLDKYFPMSTKIVFIPENIELSELIARHPPTFRFRNR